MIECDLPLPDDVGRVARALAQAKGREYLDNPLRWRRTARKVIAHVEGDGAWRAPVAQARPK